MIGLELTSLQDPIEEVCQCIPLVQPFAECVMNAAKAQWGTM